MNTLHALNSKLDSLIEFAVNHIPGHNGVMWISNKGAKAKLTGLGLHGKIRGANGYRLDEVITKPEQRGKGYANALIKSITDHADKRGRRIVLKPGFIPGTQQAMSEEQLGQWYERTHGFKKGTASGMIRTPAPK